MYFYAYGVYECKPMSEVPTNFVLWESQLNGTDKNDTLDY